MHRHGYKGRKFGRETDQRLSLMRSLAEALIEQGSIETTQAKAKELVPFMEKLITKAKKNDLHNRRQIISRLHTIANANKLMDDLAPKLTGRTSGHLTIERTRIRRGDSSMMSKVSFVEMDTSNLEKVKKELNAIKPETSSVKKEKSTTKINPIKNTKSTSTNASAVRQAPSHRRTGAK